MEDIASELETTANQVMVHGRALPKKHADLLRRDIATRDGMTGTMVAGS